VITDWVELKLSLRVEHNEFELHFTHGAFLRGQRWRQAVSARQHVEHHLVLAKGSNRKLQELKLEKSNSRYKIAALKVCRA
jgi:hypothetical protein